MFCYAEITVALIFVSIHLRFYLYDESKKREAKKTL